MSENNLQTEPTFNLQPLNNKIPEAGANASRGSERRLRYEEAFKIGAVKQWKTSGRAAHEIARELGISVPTLYSWGRETRPGTNGSATSQYVREMETEIARLREENSKLKQQCDTLKKTLGIIASFPDGSMGTLKGVRTMNEGRR